jgi:dipeptidyl aminopeptidase/acylaminoacyl peptidase
MQKLFSRSILLFFSCISLLHTGWSQTGYKTPPSTVADMLLAKRPASVSIDNLGQWMVLQQTNGYAEMEELAAPELRIAGLRINPANFSPSRMNLVYAITLKEVNTGKEYSISGLPAKLRAQAVTWSPDQQRFAFLQLESDHVDLYMVTIATKKAIRINKSPLNIVLNRYQWLSSESLLYFTAIKKPTEAPIRPAVPDGPTMQENTGKASPRPTFQDLIKSPFDESLFAFYATAQLVINNKGIESKISAPALYKSVSPSPDKRYMLTEIIKPPFSYSVPAGGFASSLLITDMKGNKVKEVIEVPSAETAPSGNDNVQPIARGHEWRDDSPSTLIWCEPLDSGLIKKQLEYHDAVYAWDAPFTSTAIIQLFKTKMRFNNIIWGNEGLALVYEGLRSKQVAGINRFNPITGDLERIFTRNTTDAYSNPGNPVTHPNQFGRPVLWAVENGNRILFNNTTGSSPKGDLPFLLSFQVHTKKADTLWRCAEGSFETIQKVLDAETGVVVTQRESETAVPNYFLKDLKRRIADRPLTEFSNPYPAMNGVTKEKIQYKRADGVSLTGDLYLPKGYNKERDGKLPVLIWAYPAEYNSAADAAQIRGSEHRFTFLSGGSPVFYVTQGYAVLNNAEMPIVATTENGKPNDNFIEQLTMNAEAAINTLDQSGVGDPSRVAVGGHSYGAFMTANLLAHTKLFKAGIARSGAYNRTLTPFGFQNEDRTYWQASELYNKMSPFSYANQIKTPILLIHGELDNNTGTFPIQSERMYNAIKGHGGTARYITLPYESHGYTGKENLLHVLAEQLEWMERFVKGTPVSPAAIKKGF